MAETASRPRSAAPAAQPWRDLTWWSGDGLRLHARDYPGPADAASRAPVLCIGGLTRNARDFEDLAPMLAMRRRVIAVDLRGRGESAYAKDPLTYVPLTYVQDIVALLDEAGIERIIAVGTSLGGLCTMLLAATQPGRVVGAVLNDVGPVIEEAGIKRIQSYVGAGGSQPTWMHAARAVAEGNGDIFPEFSIADWLKMVKRSHRLTAEGRIVPDYDKAIAAPFKVPGAADSVDLWPAFDALRDVPALLIRGQNSDILSPATLHAMEARLNRAQVVTVPNVGHAPTLDEPVARDAIAAFVSAIAA